MSRWPSASEQIQQLFYWHRQPGMRRLNRRPRRPAMRVITILGPARQNSCRSVRGRQRPILLVRPVQPSEPRIEVWSAAASADRPGELERRCQAWLTNEERQRALRFRKDTSRNQHIVGRGMARRLLCVSSGADSDVTATADERGERGDERRAQGQEHCGSSAEAVDPSRIVLGFTPHGKPFVVAPQAADRPFNVAHTEGLVLFASCPGNAHRQPGATTIGVDVERISRKTDVALAQRYFAPPEVEYVFDQLDCDRRLSAFLRVWTLKEAFIKAIGSGLTMPLADFAFEQLDSDRPRVRMLNPALGSGQHWQFIAFRPAEGYVGALAVRDWPADHVADYRLRRFESLLGPSALQPAPQSDVGTVTHSPAAHRAEPTGR